MAVSQTARLAQTASDPLNDKEARIDALFAALASGPRREILRVLAEAERNGQWTDQHFGERAEQFRGSSCCAAEVCACCFSEWLGLAPSTVSHHLRRLIEAGLVMSRKEGLWVYYRLDRAALEAASRVVRDL